MTDEALAERNADMIAQLWRPLRTKAQAVLNDMAGHGHRPRIQVAYRSEEDQLRAYARGYSGVKWGLHNCTDPSGKPDAMAFDVVDDRNPYTEGEKFELHLASSAQAHGLETGINWRRPRDPWHVQWKGVMLADAKRGKRPRVASL